MRSRRLRRVVTLQTRGSDIVDGDGQAIRLMGVNIGGWMYMENFITGYAAKSRERVAVREVLGDDALRGVLRAVALGLLRDADAAFLSSLGVNCVRIPFNYRHLEADARPRHDRGGFRPRLLDRRGRRARRLHVLDLHARPVPRTGLALGQPDAPGPVLGAPAFPGPRGRHSGRRSPTATGATPGSRATT